MRIFVTGATGFVGRQLVMRLRGQGHDVVSYSRDLERARSVLGAEVEYLESTADDDALREKLGICDAVVNLAGAPIGTRISERYAKVVRSSRVDLTRRLVDRMEELPSSSRPKVLVSASAVGYYGDRGDAHLDEASEAGETFFARLARDWEAEALRAERLGLRVSVVRLGVVLGAEGGALEPLLPLFRAGLGGRIGTGRQWMPWVHMDDVVALFTRAVTDPRFGGICLAVAPDLRTNAEFTKALGEVLHRPTLLPVPAFAVKLALAKGAEALLASSRVEPRETLARGFRFRHAHLETAIGDVLDHRGVDLRRVGPGATLPDHPYVQRRRPTHVLELETWVDAPIDEVFPFFSRAQNLGAITPPALDFRIITTPPVEMKVGQTIDYAISLGPLPMRWRTVIEAWAPGARFVDAQHRGPYRCWYHEHGFEAHGHRTRMVDRVWFASPFGLVGRMVNHLFVFSMLRRIFGFRARIIERRFGTVPRPAKPTERSTEAA